MASKPVQSHWVRRVRPAPLAMVLKRVLRIRRRMTDTPMGRFFVDPTHRLGATLLAGAVYEPQTVEPVRALLEPGDAFVDLGANEGYFSIIASRQVGPDGVVICIEPQSRLQPVLFRNIQENQAFNVHVFQRAVSDDSGMATLSLLPEMNSGGSGLFRVTKYRVPTQLVPQLPLSRFVGLLNLPKIKLLKIDIEGFEYEAVLGSRSLFESGLIENIIIELHPRILALREKSGDDIVSCLESCGYARNPDFEATVFSRR